MMAKTRGCGLWLVMAWLMLLCGRAFAVETTLVADAHVNLALPTMNSGAISNVNVGGGYTGLMQFDLSLLPAGTTPAQISRAVLRVYVNRVDTAGVISLQPLTGGWSEYGVTYQTLPAMGAAAQVFSVSQAGEFVAIDVTALVQAWVAAPATNFGFALTAGTAVAQFDSKENDLTAHPGTLDVGMVSQGPAGVAGATGPAGPQGIAGVTGAIGPAGPQGVAGTTGSAGAAGPQGIQGLPGLGFEGTYSPVTNYGLNDVVAFGGSSYISVTAGNHGNTPGSSPPYWSLLAAQGGQGVAGPQGIQGTAGAAGIQGPPGPAGAAGVAGAAGAAGTPGLVYQGVYGSTTNYGVGDVSLWQGASWVSLVAGNHGNTPSLSPAYWGVLTAQGPQGASGATGLQGPTGLTGVQGPVGPPGEQGAQGAQGIAGTAGAQGIPGTTGAQGLSGSGGTARGCGAGGADVPGDV